MRIAFIIGPFPSLSQTFVLNQITGLIDLGHDVEIFAKRVESDPDTVPEISAYNLMRRTTYFGELVQPNSNRLFPVRLSILKSFIGGIFKNPISFMRSLKNLRYKSTNMSFSSFCRAIPFLGKKPFDIIHCHFGPNGVFAVRLRELGVIGGKISTVFHGYDLSSFIKLKGRSVYDELFKKGDLFLPISHYWAEYLMRLGCPKNKIVVHRMGIDTERFRKKQLNISMAKEIKILSVARLVEKKGIAFGIEAVAEIIDDFPNIRYEIVGDGPLRDTLKGIIERYGLEEKIILSGWKSQVDVLKILKSSDILLVPSITSKDGDQEGIPVILMEGMAVGLPVISTFHSGIPELVQDGVSGILVNEKDTMAMARSIRQIASDRQQMEKMGRKGRRYVIEKYDIKRLNTQLSQLYQTIK